MTECPNAAKHTGRPSGYLAWHEWAASMYRRGARQKRCPSCGLYSIWTPPLRPEAGER